MADSFLYSWTDKKTNMLYVGYHKGDVNDGYICSSKYMLKEYTERSHDFVRNIIAIGNYKDIISLETSILKSVDAARNPLYYNKHNNNGKYSISGHSEEAKEKMKLAAIGRKRSNESCLKQSASVSKEKNPFWGKTQSKEAKLIMSQKAKKRSIGAGNNNAKSIIYNEEIFDCMKLLTEKYGISSYLINKMIKLGEIRYGR